MDGSGLHLSGWMNPTQFAATVKGAGSPLAFRQSDNATQRFAWLGLGALMQLVHASVETVASTLTILVRGDFDLAVTQDLRNAIRRSAEGGCPDITVDLSCVSFMDCAGVRGLLQCRDQVTASGGRFRLGRVSPQAARILKLTGLHEELVISTAP
jgi:anti-anti-sigma factor